MNSWRSEAVRHLRDVLADYDNWRRSRDVDSEGTRCREIYTRLYAALTRLAPDGSVYANQTQVIVSDQNLNWWESVHELYGVASALCRDIDMEYVSATFAALVRSEVFDDFLDMADHLHSAGYKDPAAVLAGAVLEAHLRKLCALHRISTTENGKPRKADAMNADLAGKPVYSKLDQKSITAWQDLRNKAAHGSFAEYTAAQVDLMLRGIRHFLSRYPA